MAVATRATAFAGKALPGRHVRVQVRQRVGVSVLDHRGTFTPMKAFEPGGHPADMRISALKWRQRFFWTSTTGFEIILWPMLRGWCFPCRELRSDCVLQTVCCDRLASLWPQIARCGTLAPPHQPTLTAACPATTDSILLTWAPIPSCSPGSSRPSSCTLVSPWPPWLASLSQGYDLSRVY